jgi:hypothetical protein
MNICSNAVTATDIPAIMYICSNAFTATDITAIITNITLLKVTLLVIIMLFIASRIKCVLDSTVWATFALYE